MLIFVHIAAIAGLMANKPTDFLTSFAKGLRVIEAFDAETARMNITEVARKSGLDRATARRCLLTLSELGYATYDGKYFSLAPRALRLGLSALASMPLSQIVQPWLDQLSENIEQSCSVAILDETEIVYVARASQRRVMSIGLMPGSRLPAHCTSMGRVLLAALPDAKLQKVLERVDLTPRTPNSIADVGGLLEEISKVREQGYSLVDQEVEIGLRSIAVPVLSQRGNTIAALNTGFASVAKEVPMAVTDFLPKLIQAQEGLKRVIN